MRSLRSRAHWALAVVVLLIPAAPVSATCGSANCFLVTGTQEGTVPKGQWVFDLSFRYLPQDRKLEGRDEVAEVLAPAIDFENESIEPDHHREFTTLNELMQIDLSYGATPRLSVAAALPILNRRYHEHDDGVGTPEEAFSNSAGTTGFGDVRLGVRAALLTRPRHQMVGSLGLELPTGPYRLRDDEGEIGEPTLMPGSGSYDVVAGLLYSHLFGESGWNLFASGTFRENGENPLDYRLGAEQVYAVGIEKRAGGTFLWSVQANGRRTGRDEYLGERVPSTGATLVNVTPGLRVSNAEQDFAFYAFAQVPVLQEVNEAQLAPRYGLILGVSKTF